MLYFFMNNQEYQPMSTQAEQLTSIDMQKTEEEELKIIKLNIDPERPKYGKMIVLFQNKFCMISLGPDYVCFLIAFAFFCGLAYLLCLTAASAIKNQIVLWLTYVLSISQCLSYLLVAISNPGISLRENNPIKEITEMNRHKVCGKCGAQSLRGTYHCRQCDVCIQGYDHHCPWTSKCIGKGNLYRFYFFVTVTPIYILFFIGLMMACLVLNAQQAVRHKNLRPNSL